ncbi:lanthionine synthetase C family protein [Chryseobacterium sp. OV279]|uniref:lanthionine synthetase C family protein n=1 Tax=Chryseobacterium sp. OV279 TaxID=1500285 RepID=UPI0009129E7E|nr:lanthionine synthetase C family protein [Chryseobacterium sp. OV279]SHF76677.1 Lanthionine synthetase C-like protein [Chryseobacterium sp. OV279]
MEKRDELNTLIRICEKEIKEDIVDLGIFTGYPGLALYYFEKHKLFNDSEAFEKFEHYLDKSLNGLQEDKVFSLCSGSVGIYYLIFYLTKNEYFDEPIEESFEEFPEYADDLLEYYAGKRNFDYLHGFMGVLFLCLELYSFSTDDDFKHKIKDRIITVVHLLKSLSVPVDEDKIAWISKGLYSKVEGFSFGFAHGIPSIISLLSNVYTAGIEKEIIKEMLDKSYNFIRSVQGDYDGSSFPNFITVRDGECIATDSSRLAWCYGDLSVGIAMLHYGKALGNEESVSEAEKILLKTTEREYGKTGVVDVFLCHGSSGLIMMYHYLYRVTGNEAFKKATDFWTQDTLSIGSHPETGMRTWLGSEGWIEQDTILEGRTGLLLQLYAVTHKDYKNPLEKLFLLDHEH